jgi:hypothetical protein
VAGLLLLFSDLRITGASRVKCGRLLGADSTCNPWPNAAAN